MRLDFIGERQQSALDYEAGAPAIELTEGIKDDASAVLCVFRGQAFRAQGFHEAAHEALKEALRSPSRSRPADIRHLALAERPQNYLAQGKKAMARNDLERILSGDLDYGGVRGRESSSRTPWFHSTQALSRARISTSRAYGARPGPATPDPRAEDCGLRIALQRLR